MTPAPPLLLVRLQVDLLHHIGDGRRLAFGDLVDVIHALDDLTPDGVLAGEARASAVGEADEKLTVGAVGIGGAGGADGATLVRLLRELSRKIGKVRAA